MLYNMVILSILATECLCHVPTNSSNVIIVGGHADLQNDAVFVVTTKTSTTTEPTSVSSTEAGTVATTTDSNEVYVDTEKEDVVFVPTARQFIPVHRNNEEVHEDTAKISELFENKNGAFDKTEKPGDILFIEGKNKDKAESEEKEKERKRLRNSYRRNMDYEEEIVTTPMPEMKLDCVNLDCDKMVESVCGLKTERTEKKYRLFLNECWYRKVNCAFTHEENRYTQVDLKFCKNVGAHQPRKVFENPFEFPYSYFHMPPPQMLPETAAATEAVPETRRSANAISGRRSMTMSVSGQWCGHSCPLTCTDHYDPECAVSVNGERRVFANHCQLDDNSCKFGLMWRRRPLSDCVGHQKADVQQNRHFINWMQKMGIVDRKGKLVLN